MEEPTAPRRRARGSRARLRAGVVVAAVLVAAVAAGAGWWALGLDSGDTLEPPAASVQRLLELRSERSTDASAYAQVVREPSVVEGLVEAARSESDRAAPIPDWAPPYVAEETATTALVLVVWERGEEDTGWPEATQFSMELRDGRWRVVDALPVEGTESP